MTLERLFHVLLKRRWLTALLLIGACIPAVQLAGKVRTDQAVEHMFPVADPTRETYDAYKAIFPYDDAHAIVVMEADDLWAEAGLVRADRLEEEFRALEGVIKVDGPVSVRDVAGSDTTISLRRIFPRVDLPDDEREQAIKTAQTDPMFAWNFAHPERKTASIQVLLNIDYARTDELRRAFNKSADEIIERHRHEWKSLMITGIPVIRGRYIQMVQVDKDVLLPLAYLVITLIVAFSYRSVVVVFGTVLTIAAALIWTVAGMAGLDMPFTLLTSFSPIIVMIISISDTVHIATDLDTRMRRGIPRRQALVEAMADGAGPCLLTEITIAAGFLSMTLVNVTAISEFGIVTAIGMMLAWFANMTVLPLILSFGRKVPKVAPAAATPGGTWVLRTWKRFIDWIEVQVTQHTRRVVGVAVVLLLVPAIAATSLDRVHLVFDDLWPESALKKEIEYGESSRGGLVPLAIFLEADDALRAKSPSPVLEPEALRFMDAAEAKMRALGVEGDRPVKWAGSVSSYLRKAHPLFAGEEKAREDGGLPATRQVAAQELLLLDDGFVFRDMLGQGEPNHFDYAAVVATAPDMQAQRVAALLKDLRGWVAANTPEGYRARVTGVLAISNRVYELLLLGLFKSFAVALLVTAIVFCFVLRSVRLAMIALVPNLAPLVIMLGVMVVFGIDLKPSTILLFSMVLVIADDDTIQYMSRFRRRFLRLQKQGVADPHRQAALTLLRDVGLPMFVTSSAVAAGFLLLCFSEFRATANLGLVTGITLFAAVFADLFLAPVIIGWWRPPIGGATGAEASSDAPDPTSLEA